MGFITVNYRDIDDNWQYHLYDEPADQNYYYYFTLPGNQAGEGKTHDWEYQFSYVYDNADYWYSSNNVVGLTSGQVIELNGLVYVFTGETYRIELFFRKYNIRDAPPPPPPPSVSTIVYDGNGATGGNVSSTTVTYDSYFTFPGNGFTRTGYTFNQWQLYGNNYSEYSTYVWYGVGGTYTIYATWTAKTYTITYDGNGATGGSITSSTATYDSNFTFKTNANGFTRTGYTFLRWDLYDSGNSFVASYNEGASYGTWNRLSNHTAKAMWTAITYTVTFNSNGKGTGKTVTQGVDTTVTCPILKAVGYIFGGWATSATSTTVNKAGNATFVLGAANQSFFAIWTPNINNTVYLSELQRVYGGANPVGMSEYRIQSGQTTANSQISLTANFKGKGPAPP